MSLDPIFQAAFLAGQAETQGRQRSSAPYIPPGTTAYIPAFDSEPQAAQAAAPTRLPAAAHAPTAAAGGPPPGLSPSERLPAVAPDDDAISEALMRQSGELLRKGDIAGARQAFKEAHAQQQEAYSRDFVNASNQLALSNGQDLSGYDKFVNKYKNRFGFESLGSGFDPKTGKLWMDIRKTDQAYAPEDLVVSASDDGQGGTKLSNPAASKAPPVAATQRIYYTPAELNDRIYQLADTNSAFTHFVKRQDDAEKILLKAQNDAAKAALAGLAGKAGTKAEGEGAPLKDYKIVNDILNDRYPKDGPPPLLKGPDGKPVQVDQNTIRNLVDRHYGALAAGNPKRPPAELMDIADALARADLSGAKIEAGQPGSIVAQPDANGQWRAFITGRDGRQFAYGDAPIADTQARALGVSDVQIQANNDVRAVNELKQLTAIRTDPEKFKQAMAALGGGAAARASFEAQFARATAAVEKIKAKADERALLDKNGGGPMVPADYDPTKPLGGRGLPVPKPGQPGAATSDETAAAAAAGLTAPRPAGDIIGEKWRGLKAFVGNLAGADQARRFDLVRARLNREGWAGREADAVTLAGLANADPELKAKLSADEVKKINGATNGALR